MESFKILLKSTPTATCCVILTARMNTLQIFNVLQSDSFTKSVFTSVLPSDRLPDTVTERPKGFIVNVDKSDGPGTHWVAIYLTHDGKGEFMDSCRQQPSHYSENFKTFLENHSSSFSYNKHELQSPWSSVCCPHIACFTHYIDVEIPTSTITSMFTDNKQWNDMLVRDLYVNGFLWNKCIKLKRICIVNFLFIPNLFIHFYDYLNHLYGQLAS